MLTEEERQVGGLIITTILFVSIAVSLVVSIIVGSWSPFFGFFIVVSGVIIFGVVLIFQFILTEFIMDKIDNYRYAKRKTSLKKVDSQ